MDLEGTLEQQIIAVKNLAKLGPEAKPATKALLSLFDEDNEELQWAAAGALGAIGPPAMPYLEDIMTSAGLGNRELAAYAYGRIGLKALPRLIRMMDDIVWFSLLHGHVEGVQNQIRFLLISD